MDKVYTAFHNSSMKETTGSLSERKYMVIQAEQLITMKDAFASNKEAIEEAQKLCAKNTKDYVVLEITEIVRPNIKAMTDVKDVT